MTGSCQTARVGKHSGDRDLRLIWGIVGAVVAILLVGGGVTYAMTRDSGSSSASGSTTTGSTTPATSAATDTATATGSPPATDTDTSRAATAQTALASCAAATAAGDTMAKAAVASARDWGIHTQAELDNESGKITYAQAEELWAETKARAPSDIDRFHSSYAAWTAKRGACTGIEHATVGTPSAAAGAKCAVRAGALTVVAAGGKVVNDQWAAHVVMMANKAHTDHSAYRARWLEMVHMAGPALATYHGAAGKLADAPSCSAS